MGNRCSPHCDSGDAEWEQFCASKVVYSSAVFQPTFFGTKPTTRYAVLSTDNVLNVYKDKMDWPDFENVTPELCIEIDEGTTIETYEIEGENLYGFTVFEQGEAHRFYVADYPTQQQWIQCLMPEEDDDEYLDPIEEKEYKYGNEDQHFLELGERSAKTELEFTSNVPILDSPRRSNIFLKRKLQHITPSQSSKSFEPSPNSDIKSRRYTRKAVLGMDISGLWREDRKKYIFVEKSGDCSLATETWKIDFSTTKWTLNGEFILDIENSVPKTLVWRKCDGGGDTKKWHFVERVFTDEDMEFFDKNGYVILKNAVPQELCQAASRQLWYHFGAHPSLKKSWSRVSKLGSSDGNIGFFRHQATWNTLQHPKIYKAFSELYSSQKLHLRTEGFRIKLPQSYWSEKNPQRSNCDRNALFFEELNPWSHRYRFRVQGMLELVNSTHETHGFLCVPECHHHLREMKNKYPKPNCRFNRSFDKTPIEVTGQMKVDLEAKMKIIPLCQGDFIIWRTEIPHGHGGNQTEIPHEVQFISMMPLSVHRTPRSLPRSPPSSPPIESPSSTSSLSSDVSSQQLQKDFALRENSTEEKILGKTLQLTPLGRKLAGLDSWNLCAPDRVYDHDMYDGR